MILDIKGPRKESILKWKDVLWSLCRIVNNDLLRYSVPCILICEEIDNSVKG
jgi:hypothetical protein